MKSTRRMIGTISLFTFAACFAFGIAACGPAGDNEGGDNGHKHALSHTAADPATCTDAGNIEYWYCSGCEKYFSDATASNEITKAQTVENVKGHTITHVAKKDAVCGSDGNLEHYTCQVCGKNFSDENGTNEFEGDVVIKGESHKLTKTEGKAATCTDAGNIEYYTCSNCGKVYSDEGKTEIKEEDTFLPAGHKLEEKGAVDLTWATDGVAAHWACSVCKKVFTDQEGTQETTLDALTMLRTTAPAEGEGMSASNINGNNFMDPSKWTDKFDSGNGGQIAAPALVGDHLEFTASARFQMLYVASGVHLGDNNAWKEGAAGSSLYGQKYLYTLSMSANGPFDLELFGVLTSHSNRQDKPSGWFFNFNGSTVSLYIKPAQDKGTWTTLWATADLGETFSFTSGAKHDIAFEISRPSHDDYLVTLFVDGYQVPLVINPELNANCDTNYVKFVEGNILLHDTNAPYGQRLSVIPLVADSEAGTLSTVNIYSLTILKVAAETAESAAAEFALLPERKQLF